MNCTRILHPQRGALVNFARSKGTRRAENASTIYSTDPPRRKGIAELIPERLQPYDTIPRSIHAVSWLCTTFPAVQLWYGRERAQVPLPRGHTGSCPRSLKFFSVNRLVRVMNQQVLMPTTVRIRPKGVWCYLPRGRKATDRTP